MPYTDLNDVHNPATGDEIPAAWGDLVRDNQEDHESRVAILESNGATALAATEAELDALTTPGLLRRVTNRVRGLWLRSKWGWYALNGEVADPKAFGAIADGTSHPLSERFVTLGEAQAEYPHATALTDEIDWAALVAAVDAAWAVQASGTYMLSGRVTLMQQTLRGIGKGRFFGEPSSPYGPTTFLLTTADAGLSFGTRLGTDSRAGICGNFEIDGQDIATQPLYIGRCLDYVFEPIRVSRSADIGVLLESAQNCDITKLTSVNNAGQAFVMDSGAGGNTFHTFNSSASGSGDTPQFEIRETYGDGPYADVGPSANCFLNPVIERANPGQQVIVRASAGRGNTMINPALNASGADTACVILDVPPGGTYALAELRIVDPTFSQGGAFVTGFRGGSAHGPIHFIGAAFFLNMKYAFELIGNSAINVDTISLSAVTQLVNENGGSWGTVKQRRLAETEYELIASFYPFLRSLVTGDTATRFRLRADGRIDWGDGTNALDTNLYRVAAGVLRTDDRFRAAGGLDTRTVATAELPPASSSMDGHLLIEDAGAGDRNLIVYAGGERFRIDGGAAL